MRTNVKDGAHEGAHCASQVAGILGRMASKNPVDLGRGVRIPIGKDDWWPVAAMAAATKRAKMLGIRAPGTRSLTNALIERGIDADEDKVGRCLSGKIVTWDIAAPLSEILEIPPPVELPRSRDEAEMVTVLLGKLRAIRK